MTLKEAAHELDRTIRTLHRWLDSGYLVAYKIGGRWEIPEMEVKRIKTGGKKEGE